jgi:hypothetical protein
MATTINIDDILKAAQTMSKDERLKLIAEIASLPENVDEPSREQTALANNLSDQEVMELTRQFTQEHKTLLRRLAE